MCVCVCHLPTRSWKFLAESLLISFKVSCIANANKTSSLRWFHSSTEAWERERSRDGQMVRYREREGERERVKTKKIAERAHEDLPPACLEPSQKRPCSSFQWSLFSPHSGSTTPPTTCYKKHLEIKKLSYTSISYVTAPFVSALFISTAKRGRWEQNRVNTT